MKSNEARLLIVDDDKDVLLSLKMFLKRHFNEIIVANDPKNINSYLNDGTIDLVLLDMNFKIGEDDGREGIYWLRHILEIRQGTPVILMTAYGEVELAVKAIKFGAFDFILKPFQNQKLLSTLQAALQLRKAEKKVKQLTSIQKKLTNDLYNSQTLIGDSPAMQEVFRTIEKVAPTDANVLILGENGTGKELAARAIHEASLRRDEAFIGVDLGSLNDNLFESELFGHVKGAFTDAKADKEGRFHLANGGSLFLDEIGNVSLSFQAKLLRVLQNRQVQAVGGKTAIPIDIRLISATNMPLHTMATKDEFRQDLLYRINTVELTMPALRNRPEDILILTNHFLELYSNKYQKEVPKLEKSALVKLQNHNWPGNVRELQHYLERLLILSESSTIDAWGLMPLMPESTSSKEPSSLNLQEMESSLIEKALELHKGNISKAAKELGLTRAALYRRLDKHDL